MSSTSSGDLRAKLLEAYKQRGMSEEKAYELIALEEMSYILREHGSPEAAGSPELIKEALEYAWKKEQVQKKREESGRLATIDVDSASDFVDAISPRSGYFRLSNPGDWLFRGHANDAWTMFPTALRPGVLLPESNQKGLSWSVSNPDASTNEEQVTKELIALREFYWRADRSGIVIPDDSVRMRQLFTVRDDREMFLNVIGESTDYEWPQPRFIALMALAQHHGLPTRLLDWTRNVYVAAYFAAREAAQSHMEKKTGVTHLAVWAFKRSYPFEVLERFFRKKGSNRKVDDIVEHSAPGATNRNLHAQEGLFLVHQRRLVATDKVRTPPFEDVIERYVIKTQSSADRRFYKFRLKISEAPHLLRELYRLGVDRASLFPGGDGVVESLKERRWWPKRL